MAPGVPTISRLYKERRLHVTLPYRPKSENRFWLHRVLGSRADIEWDKASRCWPVARAHLMPLVVATTREFGLVDVHLEFNVNDKCHVRCREAQGDDCECSCLGENHKGAAFWRTFEVGDGVLIRPDIKRRTFRVDLARLGLLPNKYARRLDEIGEERVTSANKKAVRAAGRTYFGY